MNKKVQNYLPVLIIIILVILINFHPSLPLGVAAGPSGFLARLKVQDCMFLEIQEDISDIYVSTDFNSLQI